jgi:hypothetical protein
MIVFGRVLAAAAAVAVAGCGSTNVTTRSSVFDPGMQRPTMVLVGDFTIPPEAVSLDRSLAPSAKRQLQGQSHAAARAEVAQTVSAVIGETVIARLREAGLPASVGNADLALADEPTLSIGGRVRRVDEGNRMQRAVLGFGAGKSRVAADVQVAYHSTSGKQEVLSFAAEAASGNRPGAALTAPMGVARAGVASLASSAASSVVSDKLSAEVTAHARNLGNEIAKRIIDWSAQQGWVARAS